MTASRDQGPSGSGSASPHRAAWRERIRIVIFEADTPAGAAFDVALLIAIGVAVLAVTVESIPDVRARYGAPLRAVEWVLTALFTVEYVLRLVCVPRPGRYARSFFGVVDLLAILPSYLSLVLPGSQSLVVVRMLRLLRVFRLFKLARFLREANVLLLALRSGARKVLVFLGTVTILVVILGSAMYLVEGGANGFESIPLSMYWAVVTLTTVGYGDIVPTTPAGKLIATVVMVVGYSIIAIPTGIVTAEIVQATARPVTTRQCPSCLSEGHLPNARFCRDCGASLPPRS